MDFYDPWIKNYKYKGQVYTGIDKINEKIINNYDLIMITTAHTNIDYKMIQKSSKFIFDTKNVMRDIENRENIEVL